MANRTRESPELKGPPGIMESKSWTAGTADAPVFDSAAPRVPHPGTGSQNAQATPNQLMQSQRDWELWHILLLPPQKPQSPGAPSQPQSCSVKAAKIPPPGILPVSHNLRTSHPDTIFSQPRVSLTSWVTGTGTFSVWEIWVFSGTVSRCGSAGAAVPCGDTNSSFGNLC